MVVSVDAERHDHWKLLPTMHLVFDSSFHTSQTMKVIIVLQGPFERILTLKIPDLFAEGVLLPTDKDIVMETSEVSADRAADSVVFVSAYTGLIE